jgi:hypothetical protein
MTVLTSDLRNTRQSARELRFEPTGSISATNVQTAIQQASSQQLALVPTTVAFAASPYPVKSTDTFLAIDTSGGVVVIDLQSAASRLGVPLTIKDVTGHAAAYPMSVVPNGAETVDTLAPYPITGDFGGVTLIPQTGGYTVSP